MLFMAISLILSHCIEEENVISTRNQAIALADDQMEYMPEGLLFWFWPQSVYMNGYLELYQTTQDIRYLEYMQSFITKEYQKVTSGLMEINESDKVSPSAIAVYLLSQGIQGYDEIITIINDYLNNVVESTASGSFFHYMAGDNVHQVWIDSLFMLGSYLLQMYNYTGDEDYLDIFAQQHIAFTQDCYNPQENLFHHAFDDDLEQRIPEDPIFWARGNGWITAISARYLSIAPSNHGYYEQVYSLYFEHLNALLSWQDNETGLFYTIINKPDEPNNYIETSGSALFGYSIACGLKNNLLDRGYRQNLIRIINGMEAYLAVNQSGYWATSGTSGPTVPGDYNNYISVPLNDPNLADFSQQIGTGTVLMLLSESHGL